MRPPGRLPLPGGALCGVCVGLADSKIRTADVRPMPGTRVHEGQRLLPRADGRPAGMRDARQGLLIEEEIRKPGDALHRVGRHLDRTTPRMQSWGNSP
jgi:hypothetical protein